MLTYGHPATRSPGRIRSKDEITTHSGRRRPTSSRMPEIEASPNTGIPCRRALSITGSVSMSLGSTVRTTPTTRQLAASDSSALGAVMPMPIRSTSRMVVFDAVHRLQAIVCVIGRGAGEQQFSDFEPAGLEPDDRLGTDAGGQDPHVAGAWCLLGPERYVEIVERDAIDVAPELSH